MKVLLIGVGRWGKNHLRILSGIRGIDLFVSDIDASVLDYLKDYNIPLDRFSTDYKNFIRSVDAVFIVTPADKHYFIAMDAIDAGCDIFIEKPICLNYKDALKIHEKAEEKKLIVQVGHIFRFHPVTKKLLYPYVRNGELGSVKYVKGKFKGFKRPRMDVGVTMTDSIHFVDLMSYILDEWPVKVYGKASDILGRGMDDLSLSILLFDSGVVGFIESGYFQPRTTREIVVSGDRKSLIADFRANKVILRENVHIKREKGWEARIGKAKEIEAEVEEPLYVEIMDFFDSIKSRKKPLVSALDGARAVRVVEKLYEASRKGREVEVDY